MARRMLTEGRPGGVVMAEAGASDRGRLDVGEDLRFQRREWAVQRAAWVAMALVLAAALAGLVGRGPLCRVRVAGADRAIVLEYDRFGRDGAINRLRFQFGRDPARRPGPTRLWLDRSYLEGVSVHDVFPPPDHVEVARDRMTYVFKEIEPGAATEVRLDLRPIRIGRRDGRAGLEGGPSVAFTQWVYP
jgi:hypothetical protein